MKYALVVIGGGGSGLAAACRAAEQGVKPILVLEKRPYFGGNSGMAGGWVFGVESEVQKREGLFKSCREMYKEAIDSTQFEQIDVQLLWQMIRRSHFTVEWLESIGAAYRSDGPACHMPAHLDMDFGYFHNYTDLMAKHLEEMGGQLRANARVTGIHVEAGAVQSVSYHDESSGEDVTVETDAVVLAPGGFGGNDELLCKYFPDVYEPGTYLSDAIPMDGDGLAIAESAGAKMNDYCGILNEPNYSFDRRNRTPNRLSGVSFCVWVNREGQRYCAEDTFRATNILTQQPGKVAYALFDEDIITEIERGNCDKMLFNMVDSSEIRELLQREGRKWVCVSDSWDEIAAWMGAPADALKATVEEYNQCCDDGEDIRFGKEKQFLKPLRSGPFYALKFCPLLIDTFGPVVVDREMHVLGADSGKPIRGIYAAGVICAGWQGRNYSMRGSALGLSLASGLLAGETLAKDFGFCEA